MELPKIKIMPHVALVLLVLAVLSTFSFARLWGFVMPDVFMPDLWRAPGTECQYNPPDTGWLSLSLAAIMITIMVAAFVYVLSGLFGPRIVAWNKGYMYTILTSGILVAILFLSNRTMYDMGIDQVNTAWVNTIIIRDSIIAQFSIMTGATTLLSLVGNITPYFKPAGIIGFSFSLQPASRPIFDGLGITLSMLSVAVSEWYAHEFILCFAKTRMLSFFLPVGLFCRAFGATARAGNVLIALAIGFYFVYPFMVNMTAFSIERYFMASTGQTEVFQNPSGGTGSYSWCVRNLNNPVFTPCYFTLIGEDVFRSIQDRIAMNTQGDTAGTLQGIGTYAVIHFFTGSHPATLLTLLLGLLVISTFKSLVFFVIIVSVIMPLFNLFVTITIIKELASVLGTDIDLSALEKLI